MEGLQKRDRGIGDFAGQAKAKSDFACLVRLQANGGMNRLAQNSGGILFGNFRDFHAAGSASHEDDVTGGAINKEPEIKFALDVQSFFDEQAFDDAAGGTSLRSHQLHAENVAGEIGSLVRGPSEFYAACFAAAPSVNLGFYDDHCRAGSQAVRRLAGFILGESNFAAGSRNSVTSEDGFSLVFVNLHRCSVFRSTLKQSASVRILTAVET